MDKATENLLLSKMKKYLIATCRNVPFTKLTTLGVGGTINVTVYPDTERKLIKTVRLLIKLKVNYYILGKGSNVLASDDYFDGVVVVNKTDKIRVCRNRVVALSGVSTVTLGKLLADKGLTGGEFFACLPASVGGATVGNAGCFGQDVAGVVDSVKVLHNSRIRVLSKQMCQFSKRNSLFKNNDSYVVLSVKFRFTRSSTQEVKDKISQMRGKKAQTQPLNYRSAGCVLYHDKVAVSRLIDQAGLKGYTVGGAQVSTKHAGFVVNLDKATSWDIYLVIRYVKETLLSFYGVRAKTEVCLVNFTQEQYDILTKR